MKVKRLMRALTAQRQRFGATKGRGRVGAIQRKSLADDIRRMRARKGVVGYRTATKAQYAPIKLGG